ncbi:Protein of unknown function [Actinopolyspora mzabensis]|uniref:DUF3558 domain-containing protein n=1 Tax=Actinopolyspora mzabensis TaxID=995066 RepID=A0A1G9ALP1_ACTMZ|nr:DUF3558 domain-containing protein [Actinopolyspora mzabensis]SDK27435.1 Protein of unknown function [Actinopolyspora mzabensis]
MAKVRRGAVVAGVLMLSFVLAACSADSTGQTESSVETTTENVASSDSQSGIEIENPKDAASLAPCELLPNDVATTLGMEADGENNPNELKPSLPDICRWENVENSFTTVSLTAFSGRPIQQYYDNQSSYGYFEKLDISGYPAVVANTEDPASSADCAMYMAASANQVVMSSTDISPNDVGKVNPCDLSRKALKLSLPSWPAAK